MSLVQMSLNAVAPSARSVCIGRMTYRKFQYHAPSWMCKHSWAVKRNEASLLCGSASACSSLLTSCVLVQELQASYMRAVELCCEKPHLEPAAMAPQVGQKVPLVKRWVKVRLPCLLSVLQSVQRMETPGKHDSPCAWDLSMSPSSVRRAAHSIDGSRCF